MEPSCTLTWEDFWQPALFYFIVGTFTLTLYLLYLGVKEMTTKPAKTYIKELTQTQMHKPLMKCYLHQAYCRFAIPGYCLVEHNNFICEYSGVLKDCKTFKEREVKK